MAVTFMNVFREVEHLHAQAQKEIFADSAAFPSTLDLGGGNLAPFMFGFS